MDAWFDQQCPVDGHTAWGPQAIAVLERFEAWIAAEGTSCPGLGEAVSAVMPPIDD